MAFRWTLWAYYELMILAQKGTFTYGHEVAYFNIIEWATYFQSRNKYVPAERCYDIRNFIPYNFAFLTVRWLLLWKRFIHSQILPFHKFIPETLLCIEKKCMLMCTYSHKLEEMALNLLENHIFQYTETPPTSQKADNIRSVPNII